MKAYNRVLVCIINRVYVLLHVPVHNVGAAGSSPVNLTKSSVHNGFKLWTLNFFVLRFLLCKEPVLCLLF